jgi:hypothetical protein
MADGTELTHNPTNPVRPAQAADPALALGDEHGGNGPGSSADHADAPREPSLALTDESSRSRPAPSSLAGAVLQELEDRVRSLEEKYAALQDTRVIEERVVQRLNVRLRKKPVTEIRPPANLVPEPPAMQQATLPPLPSLVKGNEPLPEAAPAPTPEAAASPAPVATIVPAPATPPIATVVPPPEPKGTPPLAAAAPTAQTEPTGRWARLRWIFRSWLILDVLNELRVMLRMLVDPRYHLTWLGRVAPLVVLVLIWLSDWDKLAFLFPWNLIPFLGYYLNKLFQIILIFVMFKFLTREVDRYRQMIPDAPRPLRTE